MLNSAVLVAKYQPLLDEVFKSASLTQDLEAGQVKFDNTKTVKILKLQVPDLANYSRNSGFKDGNVDVNWESWTLRQDRGRAFSVDAMDDEETLDMTFGKASGEFIRTKVVPEVDSYRFACLAQTTGISTTSGAKLDTGAKVIAALRVASTRMDEDEIPVEGRILYITPTAKGLIDDIDLTKSRAVMSRFSKVIEVPQSRFFTKYVYNSTTDKIEKASDAADINFMIVHPAAVQAVAKHVKLRIFLADVNQDADAHKFQYRIYHDIFAYENKVAGIYVHHTPISASSGGGTSSTPTQEGTEG